MAVRVVNLWEIENKIEKIVNDNCKEIPYEGTEVDKGVIRSAIMNLIQELLNERS